MTGVQTCAIPIYGALAIDVQDADTGSLLNWTRRVIATRNAHRALRNGDLRMLYNDDALLAFEREGDGERLLCVFNFGDTARAWPEGVSHDGSVLIGTQDAIDSLAPFAAMVLRR